MKIEVRPIQKKKWHNKVGAESFARPKTLNVLIDSNTRQYATGLDYVNKVMDDPDGGKTKLTEGEYYAKVLKVDTSPQYFEGTFHSFWDSKTVKIKLENKTMFFDTAIPLEAVKIKIMKASKFIANSMREYEDGLFPDATHVITDESEEIEVVASKVAQRNKAIIECNKLTRDKKNQIILILGNKNVKGKSDDFAEVELSKLIDSKPAEVLRFITMDATDMALHSMILEALQKNVLRKQGHKIMYYDSVLGTDVIDLIEYFKEDDNQDLKLRIMSAINE